MSASQSTAMERMCWKCPDVSPYATPAAAAVIPCIATFDGALQGFGVHIGHHEDLAAASFWTTAGTRPFSSNLMSFIDTLSIYFSAPLMGIPCPCK